MGGYELRADVLGLLRQNAEAMAKLKWLRAQPIPASHEVGEVAANLALAYRHLEDASARLSKALYAHDGDVNASHRGSSGK